MPLDKLADLAPRMSIHLGIITTPAEVAQAVADEMVKGGIQAIWNFAPVKLKVPEHIIVHQRRSLHFAGLAFLEAGKTIQSANSTRRRLV